MVGGISIGLGMLGIAAAVADWDALYQLRIVRRVASRWGHATARGFCAALGLVLISLGLCIILDIRLVR